MSSGWKLLCRTAADFKVVSGGIEVQLDGRKHRVDVEADNPEAWLFHAVIARAARLNGPAEDVDMFPWIRNRVARLMSYRFDKRRRLVANAWVPKDAGVEEFQLVVRNLATECDRLEFLLSGTDEH